MTQDSQSRFFFVRRDNNLLNRLPEPFEPIPTLWKSVLQLSVISCNTKSDEILWVLCLVSCYHSVLEYILVRQSFRGVYRGISHESFLLRQVCIPRK